MFDCGKSIFMQAKQFIDNHDVFNPNFVVEELKPCFFGLESANSWIDASIDQTTDENELVRRLIQKAEILSYKLSSTANVAGKEVNLVPDYNTRSKIYNDMEQLYNRIYSINPNVTLPSIPSKDIMVGSPNKQGGCYIATAIYKTYDCPEVWTLRRFRDYSLSKTWYGLAFIRIYYLISPTLVKWFGETAVFQYIWRKCLDRIVKRLHNKGYENTPYKDGE